MKTTTSRPTAKQRRAEAELRQALALNRAFPDTAEQTANASPAALFTPSVFRILHPLQKIERAEHRRAERICNGEIRETDEQSDAHDAKVLAKVRAILGIDEKRAAEIGLFLNGDPRGYALKLDDEKAQDFIRSNEITRDMGGYGILAPDFSDR